MKKYSGKIVFLTFFLIILFSLINKVYIKGISATELITNQINETKVLINKDKANLTVKKSVNRAKAIVGDVLEYTIVVTNIGDVVLNNISIEDNLKTGPIILTKNGSTESLDPNESIIFLGNYKINQMDVVDNKITNIAYVTAISDNGEMIKEESNEAVTAIINSSLKLRVLVSNDNPIPGEKLTYTFTVTNIGINTIKDVKINFDKIKVSALNPKSTAILAQGQDVTFTLDYEIPKDALANEIIENKALASGKDEMGNLVTSDDVITSCTICNPLKLETEIVHKDNSSNNTQTLSPAATSPAEELPLAGEKVMTIIVSLFGKLMKLFK